MKNYVRALLISGLVVCIMAGGFFYVGYKAWNPSWTKESSLIGPDGYTYCFMNYSMLQAQEMKLVRKKGSVSEEIGSNNGDSPRSWASVIRPQGALDDDYGQLYISPEGMILGIRYENKCYFAYDTSSE